jgi:hypothetical protein
LFQQDDTNPKKNLRKVPSTSIYYYFPGILPIFYRFPGVTICERMVPTHPTGPPPRRPANGKGCAAASARIASLGNAFLLTGVYCTCSTPIDTILETRFGIFLKLLWVTRYIYIYENMSRYKSIYIYISVCVKLRQHICVHICAHIHGAKTAITLHLGVTRSSLGS